jgi:cytochrome d ubiquinol oxidase subunit I
VDLELLSRVQFALTVMFHYLFPPLSIGLGVLLVLMEGTYLRTGDKRYHAMTRFWTGIFAVNFAMGVATGIVMEFQFGTNWARYARYVGDVFGSALAAEGIFAFFLESGFLAVLVFGWDRVSRGMHFFATLMVALGSMFSAVWIIVANSWQHTPAGAVVEGEGAARRAVIEDFWGLVFNPSSVNHLVHALLGSFILGAFFVMSVSAWYVLHRRHLDFARKAFTLALVFGALSSVAVAVSGHFQGRMVARHQPAKLAAMEGHFHTGPADLHLFGWPDPDAQTVRFGVAIPGGLSFLVHDNFTAPIPGLEEFPADLRPPVRLPFLSYHVMVGLGGAFIGLTLLALFFRLRGTLFEKRWLMGIFVVAVLGPYLANEAGWVATEVGRQPFVVYPPVTWEGGKPVMHADGDGPVLRTADALSSAKVVTASQVVGSIAMFSVICLLLFAVWVYVIHTKIQHGPDEAEPAPPAETAPEDLLEVAARRANPAGYSLTDSRQGPTAAPAVNSSRR